MRCFPIALLVVFLGCGKLSSPDQLPVAGPVTADTHLTLLQTTDLHDHASGEGPLATGVPGPVGGYARIAAYVNSIRQNAAADRPVVLVDSGDWTMGTVYDLTLGQQPVATYFLDTLRYDCTTLGNHEFDYTPKGLAAMLSLSQTQFGFHTPIVASNLVPNGDTNLARLLGTAIYPTYTETLSTGLKVGFIGLMGKAAALEAPSSAPVTFTDYSLNYAAIQALVTGLRTQQGCNVVIALSHAGTEVASGGYTGEDVNLAQNVTGLDVIASGHTHNAFGADGHPSHAVANGAWTTQIICAGAFTSNVARLDLTFHVATHSTTVDAASNLAMTDPVLASQSVTPGLDPAASALAAQTDAALNVSLAALFRPIFPDYSASDPSLGLYHPLGSAAQNLISNGSDPVPGPNGLGNLCADALRPAPNGIIPAALLGAGWNGNPASPTLATATTALTAGGFDSTLFTVGVVPTGIVRDYLSTGATITFANVYDVLSLGISPDSSQSLPVGYPLMSVYLTYPDLQKLCALQLLTQTALAPGADYLNLSGLSYALDAGGSYTYFKYASAALILQVVTAQAAAGSTDASAALGKLASLATDPTGATFLAGVAGNPRLAAMAALNDPAATLTPAQTALNLPVMAAVAAAAQADAANGTTTLNALLLTRAIGAIGPLAGFAPADSACEGVPTALALNQRYRVAGDLYTIFMMNAVQQQFGLAVTAYAGPTGSAGVSTANISQALLNRINLNGPQPAIQELKCWMALLLYLTEPPAQGGFFTAGFIPADYLSTGTFTDFPKAGAAVGVRNSNYPLASLTQLMATLAALESTP